MNKTNLFTKCILLTGLLFIVFHFLFLWMYTNIDGYFYWAIGEYFTKGTYPFIPPFIYKHPTTVSPPLYGFLTAFAGAMPRGDVVLHAIQLFMLVATTALLYSILSSFINRRSAAIIVFLFMLFPVNIIYASSMMTELPAQCAFTLYMFLMHKYNESKRDQWLGLSIPLTSVMTLLKYQFIFMFLFSLSLVILRVIKIKRISFMTFLYSATAVFIITIWVFVNHDVTGIWGLSDTRKMPFYTNFVWDGKHFPKETNPQVIALRKYVPPYADKYAEYWDLQDYILPYVERDWRVVDELLGNVGIAAIKEQPFDYLSNGVRIFFEILTNRAPFWNNVETFGMVDAQQPLYCGKLGTIEFCKPLIMTASSYTIWNVFVRLSRSLYNRIFPLFALFIFLPSLALVLAESESKKRIFAFLYLLNLIPISYLAFVESRYLILFYPLMVVISVLGVQRAFRLIRGIFPKKRHLLRPQGA